MRSVAPGVMARPRARRCRCQRPSEGLNFSPVSSTPWRAGRYTGRGGGSRNPPPALLEARGARMTEVDEQGELEEPEVVSVPEPDQEPHDPLVPDEADEPEDGSEEPTEAPEPQGPTPQVVEAAWKKTDRAVDAYVKKITGIWEEVGIEFLPLGLDPNSPLGFVNMDNAGRIDPELKDAALQFLGFTREQDYEPDPFAHECETCKGRGLTATGSTVGSNRVRDCPTCHGLGYMVTGEPPSNGAIAVSNSHTTASAEVAALVGGETDNWGEPRILPDGTRNENFGLQPQYKRPHPVYGVTANLSERTAPSQ